MKPRVGGNQDGEGGAISRVGSQGLLVCHDLAIEAFRVGLRVAIEVISSSVDEKTESEVLAARSRCAGDSPDCAP